MQLWLQRWPCFSLQHLPTGGPAAAWQWAGAEREAPCPMGRGSVRMSGRCLGVAWGAGPEGLHCASLGPQGLSQTVRLATLVELEARRTRAGCARPQEIQRWAPSRACACSARPPGASQTWAATKITHIRGGAWRSAARHKHSSTYVCATATTPLPRPSCAAPPCCRSHC